MAGLTLLRGCILGVPPDRSVQTPGSWTLEMVILDPFGHISKYAILATSGGVWPRMVKSALLVLNIANFGPGLAQMSLLGCFGGVSKW